MDADSLKSELDAARKERDTMEKELGDARLLVSTLQAGLSVKAEEKHNDTGAEIAQQEIMANLKQQLADAKEHIAEKVCTSYTTPLKHHSSSLAVFC